MQQVYHPQPHTSIPVWKMVHKQGECNIMDNAEKNTYVKEQITGALLRLLETKALCEISVSEITSAAGVSRVSFYRNYKEKEDILKAYMGRLFREWTAEYDRGTEHSNNNLLAAMFAHFENYREFYLLLCRRDLLYLLKDVFMELTGPKPEYPNDGAYAAAFLSYGLYGWAEEWFKRGMQESAEEMRAMLKDRL